MIFGSLINLNLTTINWSFWLAILLAKLIVFLTVVTVHRITNWGKRLGISGLYGIFVTQSNDFALGLPIVDALFKTAHPEYSDYLFLLAPISLAILNPIGLIFMEISKRQIESSENTSNIVGSDNFPSNTTELNDIIPPSYANSNDMQNENEDTAIIRTEIEDEMYNSSGAINAKIPKWKTIYNIVCGLFFNPIIVMTIAGMCFGKFVFKENVPDVIDQLIKTLGDSFSSLALFSLGLAMVGTLENFKHGSKLIIPVILVTIKTILMPIVAYGTTLLLDAGSNANETNDLAGFAFLYGTFPTAPTVYIFAVQYDIAPDMVASAMVVCTIVSAPIIYGSGIIMSAVFL